MKTITLLDLKTGALGRVLTLPEMAIAQNVPDGFGFVAGRHDRQSQRVDLSTGEVIDFQPAQPSNDHEWNAETKRWQLKPEVIERNQRHAEAQAQLEALDPKETRALSDLAANPDDQSAKERLADIRAQKDAQRQLLQG